MLALLILFHSMVKNLIKLSDLKEGIMNRVFSNYLSTTIRNCWQIIESNYKPLLIVALILIPITLLVIRRKPPRLYSAPVVLNYWAAIHARWIVFVV